jgi:hypothetical protein
LTFVGGPITHKERVALLNEINQYVPLRNHVRVLKVADQKAAGRKAAVPKVAGRPKGSKNKQPSEKALKTAKAKLMCTCKNSENTFNVSCLCFRRIK